MRTFAISEFEAHALAIVKGIAETGERVLVTKRGRPLVYVVPYRELERRPCPGRLAGTMAFEEDIVGPLGSDAWGATKRGGRK